MPSRTVEDYLKRIYVAQEEERVDRVPTGRLAADLDITPGSVTGMIKSLAGSGLVDYAPYGGVRLTAAGSRLARKVVHRHRVIELWLMATLDMSWSEVHEEAEQLEHALSDRLLERIDEKLGYPDRDPHGQPIPRTGNQGRAARGRALRDAPVGIALRLLSVSDESPAFLSELERLRLMPGAELEILDRNESTETLHLRVAGGEPIALGLSVADKMMVE